MFESARTKRPFVRHRELWIASTRVCDVPGSWQLLHGAILFRFTINAEKIIVIIGEERTAIIRMTEEGLAQRLPGERCCKRRASDQALPELGLQLAQL